MEELQKKKQHDRFYFDTLNGIEAYMETDWNEYAFKDEMLRIVIKDREMIIRMEDLETYLLALTKDPSRYLRSETRKCGIKYVPVPQNLYRDYLEYKKYKQKNGKI